MSTQARNELDRIDQNIANTYAVLNALGADMPAEQNSNNLAATAGSAKAVLYSEQTLTEAQKAQARKNIGASDNPLWGKSVTFNGDSICAGADGNASYLGGYGRIIAERNNMTYENIAHGGATVTAETYATSNGSAKWWLSRTVENMNADADYAIIEGGLNDAWQWIDHGTITIGKISKGYNAELDDTTYYGAFESMLKKLITRFQGKKIGYIATPRTMEFYSNSENVPNFYHIALECCAKWGVPVCDLNTIAPPFACLGEEYTADGAHPTEQGYLRYYCDQIETWMRSLTTGGNNAASVALKVMESYTQGFNDAITALQNGKLDKEGISFKKARLTLADGSTIEIDVLTAIDGTVVVPYINRVPLSVDTDKTTIYGSDYNNDGVNDGYLKEHRLSSSGAAKAQTSSVVTGFIPAAANQVVRIGGNGIDWFYDTAMNYVCAYDANLNYLGGRTANGAGYGSNTIQAKVEEVNGVTEFTLANLSSIAWIRVSYYNIAGVNGADLIVTVDEEITD